MRMGHITLLHNGDQADLPRRPITLLTTDYKILSKAIMLRLGEVMDLVIYPDQMRVVQGQCCALNLCLV